MWRPTRRGPVPAQVSATTTPSPWRAVSIIAPKRACECARALAGQRFLCAQAPRLPLPQCPAAHECACVYRKHEDRRAGPRRESDELPWQSRVPVPNDRRIRHDRRQSREH